jgi:hypothetical protein
MTCWRRLQEWMQAGVLQNVHEAILRRLREHDQIMWDRTSIDAASVPAPFSGEHTGRNPTDRGKLGCKHHVHGLHVMAWSHANDSANGDGSLSEPLDGFIASEDCASVMSDEQTSTRRSFRLPVLSSVGGTSTGFVSRSKL